FERISDDSPDKNSLAMIIFKSRLYFDIKRPPVIGCPTIGGHFINGGFLLYTDNKMKYKQFIIPILLFLSLFACTLIENKQFINIIMTLFWLYELSTLFLCTAIYLYCFGDFDKKVKNKIANALGEYFN
ncbi:hypothetical protein B6D03_12405, partial [Gilliamella apicola]